MKVFSERYGFQLKMESTRCRFVQEKGLPCPGDIKDCESCKSESDCYNSGGTTFVVFFPLDPEGGRLPAQ